MFEKMNNVQNHIQRGRWVKEGQMLHNSRKMATWVMENKHIPCMRLTREAGRCVFFL